MPLLQSMEALAEEDFWSEEIAALGEQQFANIDEAILELVTRVLRRMLPEEEVDAEMFVFLKEMFELDPSLAKELSELVHLKDPMQK